MMKMPLNKVIPLLLAIVFVFTIPFSFGNEGEGCPEHFRTTEVHVSVVPFGSGEVDHSPFIVVIGQPVTFTASAHPGYVFSHWGSDAAGHYGENITLDAGEDMDIIAYFQKKDVDSNIEDLTDDADQDVMNGAPKGVTDSSDQTYRLITRVNPPGGGTVSVSPFAEWSGSEIHGYNYNYNAGTEVTLTPNPGEGYLFSHFSDEDGNKLPSAEVKLPSAKVKINRHITVTANFVQAVNLRVSVNPRGGGQVAVIPLPDIEDFSIDDDLLYTKGTEVTFYTQPEEGYKFSHLTDEDGNELDSTTFKMDRDRHITVHFVWACKLTILIDPEDTGSVTVEPAGHEVEGKTGVYSFNEGTEVTLTAHPYAMAYFKEWIGGPGGKKKTIKFIINENTEIIAKFGVTTYAG